MGPPRSRTRVVATVAAAAWLLVACAGTPSGSPSGTASSPTSGSTTPSASPTPSTASASPTGSATPTPSPTLTGFSTDPVSGGSPVTGPDLPTVTRVSVGTHAGYDRFVIAFGSGALPPWTVTPQSSPTFVADPSGEDVRLLGTAGVLVVVRDVDVMSVTRAVGSTPRFPALREVRLVGAFEGVLAVGLGVRGPAAVRVRSLTGPSRLVVDVAWPG